LEMQPTQWSHGFVHHSRVRKKDCQEQKYIRTSYNLIFRWQKGFWGFEKMVKDHIKETRYAITKYIRCDYGLHLSS
jgi:hypothetical protein